MLNKSNEKQAEHARITKTLIDLGYTKNSDAKEMKKFCSKTIIQMFGEKSPILPYSMSIPPQII